MNETKQKFYEVATLPNIVGAIDGTHVSVASPGGDHAELYRNRKGFFFINVQALCDTNLCFTNIVGRWPGSTHDSRIFNNISLCYKFQHKEIDGLLLGDSINRYACWFYLMTPYFNPVLICKARAI